ncbi:hypothetical protein CTAYLR_000325 [Chrysophaeum taylorii]|uniref:Uncharacterized protein n=1 Tax=Chrysophaeum taylorii TaxID=2483200 RepID=A0AAD7UG01_9STRA|nr:hypothetical protein CTAYLR_000325 [Chrysophaeum taylorii]
MLSQLCRDVRELEARLESGARYSMSSYTSSGGPDGHVYERRVERTIRGCYWERKEELRDSRAGVERLEVERRIGERARTVTKERIWGEERTRDTRRNMRTQAELDRFDDDWAARTLAPPRPSSSHPRVVAPTSSRNRATSSSRGGRRSVRARPRVQTPTGGGGGGGGGLVVQPTVSAKIVVPAANNNGPRK